MTAVLDTSTRLAWRFFDVEVAAVRRLSPSFLRLTLTGADLDDFADNGLDQRFKLVLPDRHGGYDVLPRDPAWHAAWRLLPEAVRNPVRTYTVRGLRPARREVDVDLVWHGDRGPASRFAARAAVGDRLVVLGPDRRYGGAHGGLEFRPPAGHVGPTLLVGDATAVPAVLSVLQGLPGHGYGEVVLEVPDAGDIAVGADVPVPVGLRLTWLVRRPGAASGLPAAVDDALTRLSVRPGTDARGSRSLLDPEPDELLWEVPDDAPAGGLYAWVAGESALVTGLRRHLVRDLGVDRRSVAFMGYWREGRPGG